MVGLHGSPARIHCGGRGSDSDLVARREFLLWWMALSVLAVSQLSACVLLDPLCITFV